MVIFLNMSLFMASEPFTCFSCFTGHMALHQQLVYILAIINHASGMNRMSTAGQYQRGQAIVLCNNNIARCHFTDKHVIRSVISLCYSLHFTIIGKYFMILIRNENQPELVMTCLFF